MAPTPRASVAVLALLVCVLALSLLTVEAARSAGLTRIIVSAQMEMPDHEVQVSPLFTLDLNTTSAAGLSSDAFLAQLRHGDTSVGGILSNGVRAAGASPSVFWIIAVTLAATFLSRAQ